ncbi:MAG: hypothetical protein U0Y68_12385 [Blastocatellia bacterium]
MNKKEKTVALLQSIETGNPEPFSYLNPQKYIQHNLSIPDGIAGISGVVQNKPPQGFKVRVVRAFEDGDYTFAHTEYDFFGPKVGFDVFRFEEGLIVEHWDNLINLQPPNQSGRSQTDGETIVADLDQTQVNKQIVIDFITDNWINNKNTYTEYIADNVYLQHNPRGKDGLDSFLSTLEYFAQNKIEMYFTKIHKVLGEGNFVLSMSEGMFGENGGEITSFYDLFRLENGRIVEHWDVIEPILRRAQWQNTNGKF